MRFLLHLWLTEKNTDFDDTDNINFANHVSITETYRVHKDNSEEIPEIISIDFSKAVEKAIVGKNTEGIFEKKKIAVEIHLSFFKAFPKELPY